MDILFVDNGRQDEIETFYEVSNMGCIVFYRLTQSVVCFKILV